MNEYRSITGKKVDFDKAKRLNKKNIKTSAEVCEVMGCLPVYYMPQPIIQDDYESMAEFNFAWYLHKITTCYIKPQYNVSTSNGNYRLDIVLEKEGDYLGIEIDGKNWHDVKKDCIRDKYIVKDTEINKIVRFTGADATFIPAFCVGFILYHFPKFFEDLSRDDWLKRARNYISAKNRETGMISDDRIALTDKHGYVNYHYDIEFLSADKEGEYMDDLNCYDIDRPIIHDYTNNRETIVRLMDE